MRAHSLLVLLAIVACACAAPQRSTLQTGPYDDQTPFIEEVVVESVLQVRGPTAGRQARTNTRTNLQQGVSVAEMKT